MPRPEPAPDPLPRSLPLGRVGFWRRTAYILGPLLLTALLVLVVGLLASQRMALEMLTAAGLSVLGMGTTVILTPALVPQLSFSAWEIAWLVIYVNGVSAFLYAYNLDLMERLPRLGPYLRQARLRAMTTLRGHPWIRRLATVGVGLFVLTPLPGSGSLGGCVVGRIVGLTRFRSFVTVTLAGAIVSVGYAAFGDALKDWLDARGLTAPVRVAGAVVTLILLWVGFWFLRRLVGHPPTEEEGSA